VLTVLAGLTMLTDSADVWMPPCDGDTNMSPYCSRER